MLDHQWPGGSGGGVGEWFTTAPLCAKQKEPAMATHHEHRRVEYIARDIDTLAGNLETEARRLREMSAALRGQIADDGKPLDDTERHNIRENVRRAVFGPLRSSGYAVSVETMLYQLDRFVQEES